MSHITTQSQKSETSSFKPNLGWSCVQPRSSEIEYLLAFLPASRGHLPSPAHGLCHLKSLVSDWVLHVLPSPFSVVCSRHTFKDPSDDGGPSQTPTTASSPRQLISKLFFSLCLATDIPLLAPLQQTSTEYIPYHSMDVMTVFTGSFETYIFLTSHGWSAVLGLSWLITGFLRSLSEIALCSHTTFFYVTLCPYKTDKTVPLLGTPVLGD